VVLDIAGKQEEVVVIGNVVGVQVSNENAVKRLEFEAGAQILGDGAASGIDDVGAPPDGQGG
jgi:hypothetical protein